jgi:hypothetical protein
MPTKQRTVSFSSESEECLQNKTKQSKKKKKGKKLINNEMISKYLNFMKFIIGVS